MTYGSPADVVKGLPVAESDTGADWRDRLRRAYAGAGTGRRTRHEDGRDYGETRQEGGNRGELLCAVAGRLKVLKLQPEIGLSYLDVHNAVFCEPPADENHVNSAFERYLMDGRTEGDSEDYGDGLTTVVAIMNRLRSRPYDEKALDVLFTFNERFCSLPASDEVLLQTDDDYIAGGQEAKRNTQRRVVSRPASDIKMEPLTWLWEDRIPTGGLTALLGEEGLGKSTVSNRLAAEITHGRLPGELYGTPSVVMILAPEDAIAQVQ